jgi:hypothetical protein
VIIRPDAEASSFSKAKFFNLQGRISRVAANEAELEATRDRYRPVAERGTLLFSTIMDLAKAKFPTEKASIICLRPSASTANLRSYVRQVANDIFPLISE